MTKKEYITIPQLAELLGISRIAVYKKVKKGQISAIRIGRNYAISKTVISEILGKELTSKSKKEIDKAVKKTVREYGEVLQLLGRE
ncbi:MAG: helix-turn-helix domain-containing protein [Candidatus Aminicenantes bacterium]|nr:helix-turn-helix domain-containing protein [Candidatus Aminicenantes bacterium]